MKTIYKILFLITSCILSLQAQFRGGNGDGFSMNFTTAFFHDNSFSLYRGGIGDGFSNRIASFALNGEIPAYTQGSSGDGFHSAMFSSYLTGEEVTVYFGGEGDGFTSGLRGAFLSVNGPCVEALIKQIDSDPIANGTQEAGSQLLSMGKVRENYSVHFNAGNSIILQPGFLVENNALFTAIIKNCLTNPVNY